MNRQNEKVLRLAYHVHPSLVEAYRKRIRDPSILNQYLLELFTSKYDNYGQLMVTLKTFLEKQTKYFEKSEIMTVSGDNIIFPNGTASGLFGMLNRSEVDIGFPPFAAYEEQAQTQTFDFSYPFNFATYTFITQKPMYKPKIFGIFEIFSLSVWVAFAFVFLAMILLNCIVFKKRYKLTEIILHVFAVTLRQSAFISPSSIFENLIIYSWVIGTMILALANDSAFLSSLSFPPVTKIKHVSDLARAVENGEIHCIAQQLRSILYQMVERKSNNDFQIIASDLYTNGLSQGNVYDEFAVETYNKNLALFTQATFLAIFRDRYFISEDRLFEFMPAILVRKGFCCKKLVERFVHITMASGLFEKYRSITEFLATFQRLLKRPHKDTSLRKMTLTDVASAFIFLVSGLILSLLVFIIEFMMNWYMKRKKMKKLKNQSKIFVTVTRNKP